MFAVQRRLDTHSACLNNKVNKKMSTPKILRVFFNAHFRVKCEGKRTSANSHNAIDIHTYYIGEFGIKPNCYANCRIALVGEIVLS